MLNSPSHHRVHHGSNSRYLDRNHGSILIVWDRLFGTFEREDEPVVYGITKNIDTFNPVADRLPRVHRHAPRRGPVGAGGASGSPTWSGAPGGLRPAPTRGCGPSRETSRIGGPPRNFTADACWSPAPVMPPQPFKQSFVREPLAGGKKGLSPRQSDTARPPNLGEVDPAEKTTFLDRAYRLFNQREVDRLLAMTVDDVQWPDVAHGTVLRGKAAVRQYWEAQFAVAAPHVRPTSFVAVDDDVIVVVDQRVFDLFGAPLTDPGVVFHRYSFSGELISRMTVHGSRKDAMAG